MTSRGTIYEQLKLDKDGLIRLARLESGSGGEVACELRTFSLHEEQELDYVALSYTWGPSTDEDSAKGITDKPAYQIKCNGEPLEITENLHNFLLRASSDDAIASKLMWIDAICIDQTNEQERTSQVKLMATIYRSAALVIVWLGREDEHTGRSFQLVHALFKCSEEQRKMITPKSLIEKSFSAAEPIGDRECWLSLVKLFQRRYFTRAWIIQEVTVAQKRLAICGRHDIPWDEIVEVSKFLTITSWTRWMHAQSGPTVTESYTFNHTNPNFIEANRRTLMSRDSRLMLFSLIRARRFDASEPRDKVYALLGVAGSAVQGKPRFEPTYEGRSVVDAFVDAAVQMLEDTDDLLLLAHAEGEVFRSYPELPSWVPDWSVARAVGLGVTGYARFAASKDCPRYLEIDEENRSLTVKGVMLDRIASVAESKEEILQGKPFPRLLTMLCNMPELYRPSTESLHCTDQQPAEVLWRVLITDTGGVNRTHPASSDFEMAGLAWLRSRIEAVAHRIDYNLVKSALKRLELNEKSQILGSSLDADEYEATYSHAQHLRPFTTANKYFGIGSESVFEGDSVWIIAGSRVPLILRQTAVGDFRIVGGAYVHGFMAGQAVTSSDCFEKITII